MEGVLGEIVRNAWSKSAVETKLTFLSRRKADIAASWHRACISAPEYPSVYRNIRIQVDGAIFVPLLIVESSLRLQIKESSRCEFSEFQISSDDLEGEYKCDDQIGPA